MLRKETVKDVNFRDIFETSRDAIMLLDKKGFFDCNQATLDLFGVGSVKEFIKNHPSDLSPEKQPDGENSVTKSIKYIKGAYDKGTQFFEWTHKRIDGKSFPAEVLLSRLEIKGKPVLQAVVRDISKRKNIEKKLLKENKFINLLVKNSPLGIALHKFVFNKFNRPMDYIFLSVNPAFEKLTGLKRKNIINKKVTEVLPGIRKNNFIKIYGDVMLTGKTVRFSQFSEDLNRNYLVTAYRVGKDKFVTIFEDISKIKKHIK